MPNNTIPTQRELARMAWDESGELQNAGFALRAIADLLGADGSEHYLSAGDRVGLLHAVRSIGSAVLLAANKFAEAGELAGGSEANHG